VAFLDPRLKFWDIDFLSLSSAELERSLLPLVSNSCKALEKIDETGIEADICSTGGGVLRFCHAERGDDVVPCEDMSRGGLRFKSRKRCYDRTLIEVAVPYTPGQPSIFVPAQIVFFQELPEQQLFRYGVAYLQLSKPSNHF
jgi:hypothetical protein